MEFSIKSGNLEKAKSGCIVVGVFAKRQLSSTAQQLDKASKGHITAILKRGDMEGKSDSTLLLHDVPGIASQRVLLVGLGEEKEFSEKAYLGSISAALGALKSTGTTDALLTLNALPVGDHDTAWRTRQAIMVAGEVFYQFNQHKSKKEEPAPALTRIALFAGETRGEQTQAQTGLTQGCAIAEGMAFMRDLANNPGNVCTPTYLAKQAQKLAKSDGLKCQILERAQLEKLGMGSFLSVAQGSHQPPKFIVLEHTGGKAKSKPIVLVGKGVTFDTGGISLKPAPEMDEMKFDMSGAASVLGTLKACAQMKLPLNVVGLIPATENMPGGSATKPGDIVTSMSGQTIEILNTDAEGRLILCDALTYAERFNPACVIDIATLTGACVIALGHTAIGVFSNQDELATELISAGRTAWDRGWQLPLWDDYQEQLKSPFADMANIGGRPAGTITAACFLSRFTKAYQWAHLDIAGVAYRSGKNKGSTGRPVPLLTHFLMKRAGTLR